MKKLVCLLCVFSVLFVTACGGRTPYPVMAQQYGDQDKDCKTLEYEIRSIEGEIQRLLPKTDKTAKNVALGVAGWFFLVPLFFMDFKNAEAVEYEAFRQRHGHLTAIAMSKKCSVEPVNLPSVQQMKEEYEAQQKEQQKPKSGQNE